MSTETGIFSRMPVLRRFLEVWLALGVLEGLEYWVRILGSPCRGSIRWFALCVGSLSLVVSRPGKKIRLVHLDVKG